MKPGSTLHSVTQPIAGRATNQVEKVIAMHRERALKESVCVHGLEFRIYRNVFSPLIAPSGVIGFAFSAQPVFKNRVVADIGCGSGIIACQFAFAGARKVICTDISTAAVANARENISQCGLEGRVEVRRGRGMEPLRRDDHVDIVYADLPFCTERKPSDDLDRAFFDPDLRAIRGVLDALTVSDLSAVTAYVCMSSLDQFDISGECQRRRLRARRYITVNLRWIALTLWEIKNRHLVASV